MVRKAVEWRALIAANPLAEEASLEPARTLAIVLKTAPDPARAQALEAAGGERERIVVVGRTCYVHYPLGVGESRLSIEDKLKVRGTGRNWNTVLKLAELAGA